MACSGTTCNQGRAECREGCNKPRRTCAELGVCQGRIPPCSDSINPDQAWAWIDEITLAVRWLALGISGAFTVLLMAIFFQL